MLGVFSENLLMTQNFTVPVIEQERKRKNKFLLVENNDNK